VRGEKTGGAREEEGERAADAGNDGTKKNTQQMKVKKEKK
jgi:hypothetical protein